MIGVAPIASMPVGVLQTAAAATDTDPLREAFKAELGTIAAGAGIPWVHKDVENVFAAADGATSFLALEFDGSPPFEQRTWGAPRNNLYREDGNVWVRVVAPIGSGSAAAGYARAIAAAFTERRFTRADGRSIRTRAGAPSHSRLGGRWIESVPVAYRVDNLA